MRLLRPLPALNPWSPIHDVGRPSTLADARLGFDLDWPALAFRRRLTGGARGFPSESVNSD
jgi:hypothetical protein